MKTCDSYCCYYPKFDKIPEYEVDKYGVKHVKNSKPYICNRTDDVILNNLICPFYLSLIEKERENNNE